MTTDEKQPTQNKKSNYHPEEIESKWQSKWLLDKIYQPDLKTAKKPYYNLHMFPYPSAEGLHVGNVYAFTGADIHGRFKRMQGYAVFQPFGLDGFGIHSENYALKIGSHPMDQAAKSEKRFYKQVESLGSGYDWSHTLETYDPDYYRWTQWIFVELFKAGLAYREKVEVNWCPSCKTVLADEQVLQKAKGKGQSAKSEENMSLRVNEESAAISVGVCERCGTEVEKRELEQWMFRITEYAEQLLEGLDRIDWTEKVKIAQHNWIGKSEGARIRFRVIASEVRAKQSQEEIASSPTAPRNDNSDIEVFTTRPDTLYGATFLVVSPEHPLVASLLRSKIQDPRSKIEEYVEAASSKTDLDRVAEGKEKTGVFSGAYAINPINNQQIPIWIADYVLMSYGTGAIMAVPAHDERDFEFAKKYELPIVQVVAPELGPHQANEERRDGGCGIIFNPETQKYAVATHPNGLVHLFAGGVDKGEDIEKGVLREVTEESGLHDFKQVEKILTIYSHFTNNRKKINRVGWATTFLIVLNTTNAIKTNRGEHEKEFTLTWMTAQGILANWEEKGKDGGLDHWKMFLKQAVGRAIELGYDTTSQGPEFVTSAYTGPGVLINSGDWDGLTVPEQKTKVIADLGKKGIGEAFTNYHLRDWLISRQRYWGPPIPMIYCQACAKAGKSWFTTQSRERVKGKGESIENSKLKIGNSAAWDAAGWYPEENLPVLLPKIDDYRPLGTGKAPLGNHPEFYNLACPECGGAAQRETDVSDTFLDSAWYFYRYLATEFKDLPFPMSKESAEQFQTNKAIENWKLEIENSVQRTAWLPPTIYTGGAEHSVLHLLYARFLTKVFHDLGFVGFDEPFPRFYAHGLIIKDGTKMSKSKGNVVVPDEYIQKFGADTLRSYLMFLGPFNMGGDFRDSGIEGMYRFIKRVWTLLTGQTITSTEMDPTAKSEMNKTIKGVTEDIEEFRYNTAIAKIMTYYNFLSKQKTVSRQEAEVLLKLLSPFAPHMTEELWERIHTDLKQIDADTKNQSKSALNQWKSIHLSSWPAFDQGAIERGETVIAVQINGKLRGTFVLNDPKASQEEVERIANEDPAVKRHIEGKTIRKVIYVPHKILNFVVS
ncbi:MAG: class I tRNA ligase family protein [Patescibacteria group bacterium]